MKVSLITIMTNDQLIFSNLHKFIKTKHKGYAYVQKIMFNISYMIIRLKNIY